VSVPTMKFAFLRQVGLEIPFVNIHRENCC
jgi:hypothetical protein